MLRIALPVGPPLCVIDGPTRGRPRASDSARAQLRRVAAKAGVRRRFAPHQLGHAHAVELAHEGVPLNAIQRQLGHTNLGVTSMDLQGIDNAEIIATVHPRKAPMIPAAPNSAANRLRPVVAPEPLASRSSVRSGWRTAPDAHPKAEVSEGEGEPAYSALAQGWRLG